MDSEFKRRLANRERLIGTLLTLPSPEIAEICADAGFDWLFLDMEHGLLDIGAVQRIIQTVGRRCACLVRIPENEEMWVKKTLDTGAAGIIMPHVNTPEEAALNISWGKYPPLGCRSVGIARAQHYGVDILDSIEAANRNAVFVVQAEHIEAVRNIETILKVEGVDAIFVGPYDLSASIGKLGRLQDREVQEAIKTVRDACARHKIPSGIFAGTPKAGQEALAEGHSLVCCGMDITVFRGAVKLVADSLKSSLKI
jgi:2-keto-3-deoxy-L-rhamnonate aldolase RhmA